MSIVKSLLSRRAFTALAGAAVIATAMPKNVVCRRRDDPDHRQGHDVLLLADRSGKRPQGLRQGSRRQRAGTRRTGRIRRQRPDQHSGERRCLTKFTAVVVISPTEFKALGKPIDEAAKSVPIIGIDSGADSKAFKSFLTTDNVQGGRIAADGLAAAIKEMTGKEEGDIVILTNLPGVGSLEQRREGFLDQIKTKHPGLKVIADKYGDGQATTGLNMMTDLITANPNLVGVFASNLILAQGVGQAIAENKLGDKIKVIGFDSDDKTVGFLKDGAIASPRRSGPLSHGL